MERISSGKASCWLILGSWQIPRCQAQHRKAYTLQFVDLIRESGRFKLFYNFWRYFFSITLLNQNQGIVSGLWWHPFSHSVMSNTLWPYGLQHARLPFQHQLPELPQTHVPQVGDAIQPSHPLSSPSPHAFNLSQHQGLIQWVSSSHMAKVLEFQLQHQSFQWIFRTDFL